MTLEVKLIRNFPVITTLELKFTIIECLSMELCIRSDEGLYASVTRFGEILPIWQNFGSLWKFFNSLFLILKSDGCFWNIIWLIFIVANDQILKNNLTIWSHCLYRPKKEATVILKYQKYRFFF